MGARYRICETCVYCSFAGNCDRYDKPLTSIELPACDAYEIHPLLNENDKLRELVRDIWNLARLCDANKHIDGMRLTEQAREEYMSLMEELGVDI